MSQPELLELVKSLRQRNREVEKALSASMQRGNSGSSLPWGQNSNISRGADEGTSDSHVSGLRQGATMRKYQTLGDLSNEASRAPLSNPAGVRTLPQNEFSTFFQLHAHIFLDVTLNTTKASPALPSVTPPTTLARAATRRGGTQF